MRGATQALCPVRSVDDVGLGQARLAKYFEELLRQGMLQKAALMIEEFWMLLAQLSFQMIAHAGKLCVGRRSALTTALIGGRRRGAHFAHDGPSNASHGRQSTRRGPALLPGPPGQQSGSGQLRAGQQS